jgi:uncharacterized GH25 family protein
LKKIPLTILLLITVSFAQSHEFWLQPKKFTYAVGEEMVLDFMVGENFTGEFWDLKRHKVEKIDVYASGMTKSLLTEVKDTKGKNLTYKLDKEGTHLFALESNFAYIGLEPDKFNEYLKDDGLENILEARTKQHQLDKPSKEFYKRYAKVIVQSGKKLDETYRKRLGLRIEIVPLTNPYSLKSGDYLECLVLWEGKPTPHTLVKVWNFVGRRSFLQNIYSENDGTIKFPISSKGPWMVSSVKMMNSEKQGADYQSLWASLVFEIE